MADSVSFRDRLRRPPRARRVRWFAPLAAALAACSGGGGGSGAPPPSTSLSLQFVTPQEGQEIDGDAPTLVVAFAGATVDQGSLAVELDGAPVAASATFEADQLTVALPPLATGDHTLSVTLADDAGVSVTKSIDFRVVDAGPPPPVGPPPAVHVIAGATDLEQLGLVVAGAGELDGDGRGDFLVTVRKLAVVRAHSGLDGSLLYELSAESGAFAFGTSADGIGDVDGDGRDDVAVGAPSGLVAGETRGFVDVYSGATGTLLRSIPGEWPNEHFGSAVAPAGDVDLDGVPDVAIGARFNAVNGPKAGRAAVHSGADGTKLFEVFGTEASDQLGISLAGVGDVDGDGHDDVLMGAWGEDAKGGSTGGASLRSGFDGSELLHLDGFHGGDHFGNAVGAPGDVDGDGTPDLLVGAWEVSHTGPDRGAAYVFSGADGTVLLEILGDDDFEQLGCDVAGLGDVDGDGTPDLLIGAWMDLDGFGGGGTATIHSGADGSVIQRYAGAGFGGSTFFGLSLDAVGDLDGDGLADLVVGAPADPTGGLLAGSARVFSSAPETLAASVSSISLSTGGAQALAIDLGPDAAGRPYAILGSTATGAAPDPWALATGASDAVEIEGPYLARARGSLDALGRATATVTVPAGSDASLAGLVLRHAAIVIESDGRPRRTNEVGLTLRR